MFEKAQPVFYAHNARFAGPQPAQAAAVAPETLTGRADYIPDEDAYGEERLRIIDWSELTARLNAARDLRRVLKREARADARNSKNGGSEGFADAAARYFLSKDTSREDSIQKGERDVNPVALEQRKGSSAIPTNHDELLMKKAPKPKQATTGLTAIDVRAIDPRVTEPAKVGDAREY